MLSHTSRVVGGKEVALTFISQPSTFIIMGNNTSSYKKIMPWYCHYCLREFDSQQEVAEHECEEEK